MAEEVPSLKRAVEGRALMKASRLRAGLALLVGAALLLGALAGLRTAVADEAQLREALADYEAGRYDEALDKLHEYVESNPGQEEVYTVLRDVEDKLLISILARQGEHERLLKYLLGMAQPEMRRERMDTEQIQNLVRQAVEDESLDVRRRAGMRLRVAGDLAVPYLYPYLASQDAAVVVNAMFALQRIGSQATFPLAEVMRSDDARLRGFAAVVLGDIRDPRGVPALLRAKETDEDLGVQQKATAALAKVGTEEALSASAAGAYVGLGERFYADDPGVVAGFDEIRNMWRWEGGALARYEVPAYLYPYQMAEQFSLEALELAPENMGARTLLVRSLLAQQLEAEMLRASGEDAPEALGAALDLAASQGFETATEALRASLLARDWDVAIECIDLVRKTYARESLHNHPLGAALIAPERRVRYAAAIAALLMSPQEGLPNAGTVANLAARAASERAIRQVLVIDDREETRSRLVMDLAHAGYVAAGVANGAEGVNRAKNSPTLDVVVVRADLGDASRTIPSRRHASSYVVIDELMADARTKDVRIVVLVQATPEGSAEAVLTDHFENKYGDGIHGFISVPIDTAAAVDVVNAAAEAGDLNPDRERANELAAIAAGAFAQTDFSCVTFDLSVAVEPLSTAALEGPTPEARLNAVRALGNIRVGGAAALATILRDDAEDEELRAAAAAALGAVLSVVDGEPDQVEALIEAAQGEGEVAESALRALGHVRALTPEQRREIFKTHRLEIAERAGS